MCLQKSKGSFIEAWICFEMGISLYIIEKYASILPMDFSLERCSFLLFCLVSWSFVPWNNKCMKFFSVSSWWCVFVPVLGGARTCLQVSFYMNIVPCHLNLSLTCIWFLGRGYTQVHEIMLFWSFKKRRAYLVMFMG